VDPTGHLEHGRFLGGRRKDALVSVVFFGNSRNLTSFGAPDDLGPVFREALTGSDFPRLFVGPAAHAPHVRRFFGGSGASPVLDREQVFYVLTPETLMPGGDERIRPARPEESDLVARAQAEMTEEDLLIPRSQIDVRRLREISRRRIREGKIWVIVEDGRLRFKTEDSARTPDGMLVGGVFTDPELRGRGLATRALAVWARRLFDEGLSFLALHVNAANVPAIRAYERVGFRRHSTLRLILTY